MIMDKIVDWADDLWQKKTDSILTTYEELPGLPITQFYKYLLKNNRELLLKSFLINYVLPFGLELLP